MKQKLRSLSHHSTWNLKYFLHAHTSPVWYSVKIQASADSQDETENHVEDVDEEGQAEEE